MGEADEGTGDANGGDPDEDGDGEPREVTAPLLFLVGVLTFLGGGLAFLADLVTGHDVLRSLLINGGGAGLLVSWAAVDTLGDPEARVSTATGAAGTALLLYGLYMVVAGLVVAATTFRHGRLFVGVAMSASGASAVLLGFLVFPREAVPEADDGGDGPDTEGATTPDGAGGQGGPAERGE